MRKMILLGVLLVAVCGLSFAGDEPAKTKDSAAWAKMKTLVGSWEGSMMEGGQKQTAHSSFRMTSNGSVLMNVLGEGTQHEMVTMIHPDVNDLVATHYCAAMNQPRMKYVPGKDPNQIAFEFKDITNLKAPEDGHMNSVVFTFDGPDHHAEDWNYIDHGKKTTGHFDFKRTK